MLYQQERQTKKDSEDNKSVLSSKSIKSLTKQLKTLKKPVSTLQALKEDSNNISSLSSEDGDAHFQYACAAIEATNPKVSMTLKSHKTRGFLDNQSTFDLCCNPDFAGKKCNAKRAITCRATGVVCEFPRNVWFLVMISRFGLQQGQWLTSFVSRTWSTDIRWLMIVSCRWHSLYIERNLVSWIWSLICIHVGCMSTTPRRPMVIMVLFLLLQTIWSCSPSNR